MDETYIKYRKPLIALSFLCLIAGIFVSRALLSIATMSFFAVALTSVNLKTNIAGYFRQAPYYSFFLLFLLYLIGGLWSENSAYFITKMTGKLTFVSLSFGIFSLTYFKRTELQKIYYLMLAILCFMAAYTFFDFFTNFETRTANTHIARYVNAPTDHIRFSLLIANAIFISIFFINKPFSKYPALERSFLLLTAVFLIIFLHFLAARSGIIAFYIVIFLTGLKFLFQKKNKLIGISSLLIVVMIPYLAYQFIPSFKDKITYTIWDIQQYRQNGDIEIYADSNRIVAYDLAFQLIKKQPFFGYGTADVKKVIENAYDEIHPDKPALKKLQGSNQFLYMLLSFGVAGLLVFCFILYLMYPFKNLLNNNLLFSAATINIVSFLPENTIEIQYGLVIFCLFVLMANQYQKLKE